MPNKIRASARVKIELDIEVREGIDSTDTYGDLLTAIKTRAENQVGEAIRARMAVDRGPVVVEVGAVTIHNTW